MPTKGAQPGNRNAQKHGAYTRPEPSTAAQDALTGGAADSAAPVSTPIPSLTDLLTDLREQQARLRNYIDNLPVEDQTPELIKAYLAACNLYSNNIARQARMVKMLAPIGGEKAQKLADAMNEVLDQLSDEFGVTL